MALLALAYPKLAASDLAWIEAHRERHDPHFTRVRPHFTLVFAISDFGEDAFVRELQERSDGVRRIEFELALATLSRDASSDCFHEFLVPESGYAAIVRLHDRLYSGLLSRHLRLDVDFIPHIGIGRDDDALAAKARVDALNQRALSIPGLIDALDVVEHDAARIATICRIGLA